LDSALNEVNWFNVNGLFIMHRREYCKHQKVTNSSVTLILWDEVARREIFFHTVKGAECELWKKQPCIYQLLSACLKA